MYYILYLTIFLNLPKINSKCLIFFSFSICNRHQHDEFTRRAVFSLSVCGVIDFWRYNDGLSLNKSISFRKSYFFKL